MAQTPPDQILPAVTPQAPPKDANPAETPAPVNTGPASVSDVQQAAAPKPRRTKRPRGDAPRFWPLFAAVVAGTVPSLLTNYCHARAEEHRLLLDRRIAAMGSYLSTCQRSAAPYAYPSEVLAPELPATTLADQAIVRDQRERIQMRLGELWAQEAVVGALFRIEQGSLGLPPGVPPNMQTVTLKQLDAWVSQRAGAAQMRCIEVGGILGERLNVPEDAPLLVLPPAAGPVVVPERERTWMVRPAATKQP
jgi:hypothetical protein